MSMQGFDSRWKDFPGYVGSTGVAGYTTTTMPDHLINSRKQTAAIVQIEEPERVVNAEAIAAEPGIDSLVIGQVDLTVAYGADSVSEDVDRTASLRIIASARKQGKPVGMFLGREEDVPEWSEGGFSFFGIASEHKMILDRFHHARQQRFRAGSDSAPSVYEKPLPDQLP